MSDDARFDRLEQMIDAVHKAVIHIEQDHGAKLEVLFDGQDQINRHLGKVDQRLGKVEHGIERLEAGHDDIRRTMDKLVSIANDHDVRLQNIEG